MSFLGDRYAPYVAANEAAAYCKDVDIPRAAPKRQHRLDTKSQTDREPDCEPSCKPGWVAVRKYRKTVQKPSPRGGGGGVSSMPLPLR